MPNITIYPQNLKIKMCTYSYTGFVPVESANRWAWLPNLRAFSVNVAMAEQHGQLIYEYQEHDVYYRIITQDGVDVSYNVFERTPVNNIIWNESEYDRTSYARTQYRICSNIFCASSCSGVF